MHVKQSTRSRVADIGDLSESDSRRMYEILCEHFADVDRSVFDSDLREKSWVVLVEDDCGNIQGFSTLQRMTLQVEGRRMHAFFSGDTVLSNAIMGDASWIPVWTRHVFGEAARLAPEKCYWLLLTATHRTYRILPTCFKEFLPRPEKAPSPEMKALMGQFVRQKFPDEYREDRGLVVLSKTIPYRRPEQVGREVDSAEHHSATRYFKKVNPDFLRGDFLCCLAELSPHNLTPIGQRILSPETVRRTMAVA
jgi:hypothetical protein